MGEWQVEVGISPRASKIPVGFVFSVRESNED